MVPKKGLNDGRDSQRELLEFRRYLKILFSKGTGHYDLGSHPEARIGGRQGRVAEPRENPDSLTYGLVSRESKAKGCGPETTHLRLNPACAGLIRQFISLVTMALGTS